jgi:uncharacterized lipoprotein YmbA
MLSDREALGFLPRWLQVTGVVLREEQIEGEWTAVVIMALTAAACGHSSRTLSHLKLPTGDYFHLTSTETRSQSSWQFPCSTAGQIVHQTSSSKITTAKWTEGWLK